MGRKKGKERNGQPSQQRNRGSKRVDPNLRPWDLAWRVQREDSTEEEDEQWFAFPPPEGSHRLISIPTEEDSPWCETGWPGDDGGNGQWDSSPPYEGNNWPDLSPTEGDSLLSPIPLSGEEMVLLPLPPPAGAEQQELPLPLPPPPAEGEYLLVPFPPPWEDCLPLPPPPAEGEYLLVPSPPPWEGLLLPCLAPPKDACCSASPGVACCSALPVESPVIGYEGEMELPLRPPWPEAPLPSSPAEGLEGPLLLLSPPEGPLLLPSPPEGPLLPSPPEGPLLLSPALPGVTTSPAMGQKNTVVGAPRKGTCRP
ncbi:UNVERIFIED_CONTAM: hypothetical protein FKN15_005296 [Acipenser sinensis]